MTRESDEELVRRCRDGDAGAFRTLVARYERPLYNAAWRVLGDAEDASDATQVAFLEVATHLDQFDPAHRFFSWIYRIALNAALNLQRRQRKEAPVGAASGAAPMEPATPESQVAGAEEAARLQGALLRLSADHRAVLALRHFSGCSYREIGHILALEEKTVRSRLFEARQRLRQLLADLERR